jgi:predicted RNA-binding Zn-ribbon protein involved in translation (DUF1610 family)
MGHKNVCLSCRVAFNMRAEAVRKANCPNCNEPMTYMSYNFRPPRKSDIAKWGVVKFYVDNGFIYNHVYERIPDHPRGATRVVKYPENLREAKEFVEQHKK